jgi:hypothetical protein
LVRNTITNLTSQDEQAECFRTVAAYGLTLMPVRPRVRVLLTVSPAVS